MARAHGLAGDAADAARYRELALEAADQVTDDEDRELVVADLGALTS